ncbi:oxidized low-density lipoprotein receptor 1-like [Desmodus rotundus]|uniref:oxidized low-density lipoprotein receptor 1-like n=1 Tax=Desmodus rotundus TaxID=9430 RepID=UPI0023810BA4|nr:oxidized low-density lipoprotein receptor 1-like [Desmodus rotundus]XP_045040256.2 oxidized low-density lipoprotein receptor 1-like [Desmodus rotundus]
MSNSSDSHQPPEITEQTEIIPIVDLETPLAFPPAPSLPESELGPISEHTNRNASACPFSLYGIMPVVLGIFSLLLLVLCGFFGYQYFESIQALESKMKNFNQWIESFQNKAENLPQVQKDLDEIKETLDRLQKQNEHLIKVLQELNAKQGDQCGPPLHDWVKYGDYCYFQSTEMVSWSKCCDVCASLNATFLTTERNGLMNIMVLPSVTRTWLGLSYNKTDHRWEWEDGSSPSFNLSSPNPSLDSQGVCVYVNVHTIGTDSCTTPSSCLCEKPAL